MILLSAKKMSQISSPSDTPIFADSILFSTAGGTPSFKRPNQIHRPDHAADGYDTFQGRHTRGTGNVGFYDGHVEAIVAQIRPAHTYTVPRTAAQMEYVRATRLGPLYPRTIDFTSITSPSDYRAQCASTFNFYFWLNKNTKSLTY